MFRANAKASQKRVRQRHPGGSRVPRSLTAQEKAVLEKEELGQAGAGAMEGSRNATKIGCLVEEVLLLCLKATARTFRKQSSVTGDNDQLGIREGARTRPVGCEAVEEF